MKKISILLMFLVFVGFAVATQASTITKLDHYLPKDPGDLLAFTSILPNTLSENFEDATLATGLSITEVGGAGVIGLGVYQNRVDISKPRYQIFNYSTKMYGFGGWFDLAGPGGPGSEIDVYINDSNEFVMTIPRTATGEFYGFVSDVPFTGVLLKDHNDPLGLQESYAIIDLAILPAPIPDPPSVVLFISGLLGLVGLRRMFKN